MIWPCIGGLTRSETSCFIAWDPMFYLHSKVSLVERECPMQGANVLHSEVLSQKPQVGIIVSMVLQPVLL